MKTVVTGATGLVGRALLGHLQNPVVLSRNAQKAQQALGHRQALAVDWNPMSQPAPAQALEDADVVFHMAGEPVAGGRWTPARKQAILESRVTGTRHLVEGLAAATRRPRALVCASAVGIYGDRGDEVLVEDSATGNDFLAEVCRGWEREAARAQDLGVRVVRARLGVVLAPKGGALEKMLPPFRLGVGGRLGSGTQWMSWVHLEDVVGLLLHAAKNDHVTGPMNVVSPNPVTNADFTRALAKALHRPAVFPVPGLALRAMVGEMADMLLGSQRVMPQVAQRSGYQFVHDQLGEALATLLTHHPQAAA